MLCRPEGIARRGGKKRKAAWLTTDPARGRENIPKRKKKERGDQAHFQGFLGGEKKKKKTGHQGRPRKIIPEGKKEEKKGTYGGEKKIRIIYSGQGEGGKERKKQTIRFLAREKRKEKNRTYKGEAGEKKGIRILSYKKRKRKKKRKKPLGQAGRRLPLPREWRGGKSSVPKKGEKNLRPRGKGRGKKGGKVLSAGTRKGESGIEKRKGGGERGGNYYFYI